MCKSLRARILVLFVLLLGGPALLSFAAQRGPLQVGAARVDITPAPDAALPMGGYADRASGFQRIHDHIYARAIVISNGNQQMALLALEVVGLPTHVWEEVSARVAKELGIPSDNVIFAAVHDHSAPTLAGGYGTPSPGAPSNSGYRPPSEATIAYTAKVENDMVEAVRRAKANLQPAQFGFGTHKADVNINRREFYPEKGWWWLGQNPDGPSDKTVAVLKFADLSGKPIAFFINYPVHCAIMGPENLAITGELAGATSRYVEQYYQGKIPTEVDEGWEERLPRGEVVSGEGPVAVWTSGAAGDQNPVSMVRGEDFTMVDGLGRLLGEESVRAANTITVMSSQASIVSSQRVITCPGRRLAPGSKRPSTEYTWVDSDPVNIRLSLLRLNDVALAGVSGEVFTEIYQHLKRELPGTIMVTHANGSSGYIPSDDSFDPPSYEVTTSHLKPGCAENSIVNGFLEMMGSK